MPGYWMHETSGVLRPVIEAYLSGAELTPDQVATMRAYLRQWMGGAWRGVEVAGLIARLDGLATTADIETWLDDALEIGIDPL